MNNLDAVVALLALQQNRLPPAPTSEDAFYNRYAGTEWPWLRRLVGLIRSVGAEREVRPDGPVASDEEDVLSRNCGDDPGAGCPQAHRLAA